MDLCSCFIRGQGPKWADQKLLKLAEGLGKSLQVLDSFNYEIPKTDFDKSDLNKWKANKYGRQKGIPKHYHKEEMITISCCLFVVS